VEYPSGSGKYVYDDAEFEAIQPPPVPQINDAIMKLSEKIPERPDGPYYPAPGKSSAAPVPPATMPPAAMPSGE